MLLEYTRLIKKNFINNNNNLSNNHEFRLCLLFLVVMTPPRHHLFVPLWWCYVTQQRWHNEIKSFRLSIDLRFDISEHQHQERELVRRC
jgi:hypothetical protein